MVSKSESEESLQPKNRAEWRAWLAKNHDRPKGTWLFQAKKGARVEGISHEQAVEEALCFGWIDSKVVSCNESFFKQWFSPRKKGGIWSKLNKEKIERLIETGQMTPAGMAKINAAKRDRSWDSLDEVEALSKPDDLIAALSENELAKKNFDSYSDSAQKMLLRWLDSARRQETRASRIREIIAMAERGESIRDFLSKK